MTYRSGLTAICVAVMVIGLFAWVASAQDKGDTAGAVTIRPFKPVQPMKALMLGHKKLFGEIRESIIDEKWDDAATSSWILAEMANVNSHQRDIPKYQQFADHLSQQASELAKALEKKDGAKARQFAGEIGKSCKDCHDQYRKD